MSACFIKRNVKARKVIKKPNFDYEYKLMSTKTGFKILVYKIMFMWLISNCIFFQLLMSLSSVLHYIKIY